MGFSFTLPPRTNYSLSCRSGYFRLLAETQHNGLIHGVTCRVFGDALLLGPFPCRLRWREAVAHSQPWFQTPAMKASSSSSGRSEGPLAGSRAAEDWLFLSAESAAPQHLHTAADEHEVEDRGKLKSKLVSAWNSVKYGLLTVLYFFFCVNKTESDFSLVLAHETRMSSFHVSVWSFKPKSKFGQSSPVVMLGKSYELREPGQTLGLLVIMYFLKQIIFFNWDFFFFFDCNSSRGKGALLLLLCVTPVADLQTGLSSTSGQPSDHGQWVGLRFTDRSDAAGARTAPAPHASR